MMTRMMMRMSKLSTCVIRLSKPSYNIAQLSPARIEHIQKPVQHFCTYLALTVRWAIKNTGVHCWAHFAYKSIPPKSGCHDKGSRQAALRCPLPFILPIPVQPVPVPRQSLHRKTRLVFLKNPPVASKGTCFRIDARIPSKRQQNSQIDCRQVSLPLLDFQQSFQQSRGHHLEGKPVKDEASNSKQSQVYQSIWI